ncbi:UNVERIFIED_CONTAM: hypothetical protein H355_003690, partial [Colinus virginianus]
GDREQVYCELESVLRQEDSHVPCGVLNRLLAEVSQDLMAAQGVAIEVKMAASNILVALARSHFSLVMAELQSQLKAVGKSREFVLITLSRLFSTYEHKMTEKLPQVVEAVQRLCGDPRTQVRKALLHFIKDLLSVDARSCSAWDVVGHIFSEFSHSTRRMAAGDLSAQEAREEGALQELCVNILGSLDVSVRGMTKLLWPRLMQYVVPAQYTGMLIPVSRCIRALAEREDLAARETEELDSHFLNSLFQGRSRNSPSELPK